MARILVVDDHLDFRDAVEALLKHAGHEVSVAKDGKDALNVFRRTPADLVLCDLLMPERDGLEAILDLCREFPTVKIIAMTGAAMYGSKDILAAAKYFGAIEVMSKPLEPADLLRAVKRNTSPPPDADKRV
jgi:CheY-like chemotaxis protein